MYKRFIEEELLAFLKIMPVVLIMGARQAGKTTLVESIEKKFDYNYITFDDENSLANAKKDPAGWLNSISKPVILDEIQRVPELFLSIKKDVDINRHSGRYILTGSANPMLLPALGDSLAGRMGIINMYPFSQAEIRQRKEKFIPNIFSDQILIQSFSKLSMDDLYKILFFGGFPPVQSFEKVNDVDRWIYSYIQTILKRDIKNLANIEGVYEFPRLFKLLATRSSKLLNVSELSRSLDMVHMTMKRYLNLLETLFFIYMLPSWYTNHGKRVTKSPKLHIGDSAILSHLIEVDKERFIKEPPLLGQFLETLVFSELIKQKSFLENKFELFHFRQANNEVDFVIEKRDGSIVGIEVKCSKKIKAHDLRGLKALQSVSGKRFKRGIVLHLTDRIEQIDEGIYSMPLQALWEYN